MNIKYALYSITITAIIVLCGVLFMSYPQPHHQEQPLFSFLGFSDAKTVTVIYISSEQSLEKKLVLADNMQFILPENFNQAIVQIVTKENDSKETYTSFSKKNNIIKTQFQGLTSRERITFNDNKIIPADWSGQLKINFTATQNFCVSFNKKEICYHSDKGVLKS